MADHERPDTDALREEVARLRAENEQLRSRYRVAEPSSAGETPRDLRPVRVLLLPDPLAERPLGRIGPEAVANMARAMIGNLREQQPHCEWRAEHDLARVPDDADCFHVGQVLRRIWDGTGSLPMTFRVEQDTEGHRQLRRCLIAGESDSDRFTAGYDRQLRVIDDLMAEGQAAHDAGAEHHAIWTLKAIDVILAHLKVALASFQAGKEEWREALAARRAEYDPRYRVDAELPTGM